MPRHSVILIAVLAATGLGLAGCHKKPPNPVQHAGQAIPATANQAAPAVSDSTVTANVKAAFAANAALNSLNLGASTHNGIVTLTGTVPMVSRKDLAARVAHGVAGVKRIVNRIRIKSHP